MIGAGATIRVLKSTRAALKWSEELSSYVRDQHGVELECWSRIGAAQEIVWFARYPDLSAYEKQREVILTDDKYWKKIKEAEDAGFFDMTSFEQHIWQKLA